MSLNAKDALNFVTKKSLRKGLDLKAQLAIFEEIYSNDILPLRCRFYSFISYGYKSCELNSISNLDAFCSRFSDFENYIEEFDLKSNSLRKNQTHAFFSLHYARLHVSIFKRDVSGVLYSLDKIYRNILVLQVHKFPHVNLKTFPNTVKCIQILSLFIHWKSLEHVRLENALNFLLDYLGHCFLVLRELEYPKYLFRVDKLEFEFISSLSNFKDFHNFFYGKVTSSPSLDLEAFKPYLKTLSHLPTSCRDNFVSNLSEIIQEKF